MKKYQPERTDLLINTDWGIPPDRLSKEEATRKGMKLFHKRWVTKEERKQLREEYGTYHSIRITGGLLIVLTLVTFINIGEIFKGGIIFTLFAAMYGFAMLTAGIGMMSFNRFAWYVAVFVFLPFIVLPFTPLFEDEKGAPLLIMLGVMGLYCLLRKTARKIFAPPAEAKPSDTKQKSSFVRKAVYAFSLLLAALVLYTFYDLGKAGHMAADACNRAIKGMPLEDYFSTFSENDYKIIKGPEYTMIIPKRGMGRYHCTVSHDGQKIIGSKTGFND